MCLTRWRLRCVMLGRVCDNMTWLYDMLFILQSSSYYYNFVFVLRAAAQKASYILLKIHQIIMDIQCRLPIL